MRSIVVVLVLASACTQTQARSAHRVGEVATATGLIGLLASVTVATAVPSHETTFTSVGLAFVPVAVLGALLYISTDSLSRREPERVLSRRERHRAAAWDLTKRAASAARAEDCTQVQAIAPRVRELDLDFHVSVFMRDVAIQRCLREH
jgi:hypothetical protein